MKTYSTLLKLKNLVLYIQLIRPLSHAGVLFELYRAQGNVSFTEKVRSHARLARLFVFGAETKSEDGPFAARQKVPLRTRILQ
jgi:hypothetical protein